MTLSFEDAQEALMDRLKATDIPNVFEADVPPGFILPTQNNAHLPYVCISFGGMAPIAGHSLGITGSRQDLKRTSVIVQCFGDSPKDVRTISRIVREQFEGYEVDATWGQLSETVASDYRMWAPDHTMWPVRYVTGIYYNALVNGAGF